MDEICKIIGCKAPAISSKGLCHEHDIEDRKQIAYEELEDTFVI